MGADWLTGGERRDLAARRIRAAARDLLLERGIDRFSVEAVAQRAGCSRATLYRVVGGKKALLDQVFAEAAGAVAARVAAGTEGLVGEERVARAILIAVAEIRSDRAVRDWVVRASMTDDYLQSSADLSRLAVTLTGSDDASPLAGDWILRVVLGLVVWPPPDPGAEESMVRSYVAPAFVARAG